MSFLKEISQSLINAINKLKGSTGDEASIKEFIRDIQRILIKADVNLNIVLDISKRLEKASKENPPPGFTRKDIILKELYDSLIEILGGSKPYIINFDPSRRNIIMLVGIQGSGKTTTAAKLARYFKIRGYNPGLICADTYRLGAYYQLKQLAEKVQVEFYGDLNEKDPVKIVIDGIKYLESKNCNIIIIDTAGRHKDEKNLMEEMKLLSSKINPDHVMLVIDGTIGQSAYNQAKAFNESTKIGSIIVTKLDGSAKGGGAISAAKATNAKISFIGTGEGIEEFELFNPVSFVNRLLGMGDLEALAKRIEEAQIKEEITKEKFLSGEFTIKEMVMQIKEFRKAGPLGKLLSLIPGFNVNLPEEMLKTAEESLKKWEAIINSMRSEEIKDPKIIDKSRARRIARGSGVDIKEVERLIESYFMIKRNIKRFKRFGFSFPTR
jgi:Signal recognition particle GTPase